VSRALTFWNDETIALVRENFIACSLPTWVARSAGPEGEFLRAAGIDKHWVTSSGYMNCVSAGGKFLGGRPCQEVLEKFAELPAEERQPAAVKVPRMGLLDAAVPAPPEDGLILRVHARFLSRDPGGELRQATTGDFPLMADKSGWGQFLQPNTECMWLTREEARSLVPANPAKGQRVEVDPVVAERMARFHLTPKRAMTSEGGIVGKRDVRAAELALVVEEVTPERVRLRMEGTVHTGSEYDESQATSPNGPLGMGFQSAIHGVVEFDRRKEAFTRFDIIAPGDVWGRWGDANGKSLPVERPGRAPFGFAFELGGDSPTDRIPPGGNGRYITGTGYFAAGR
jgi:hypothetical protein